MVPTIEAFKQHLKLAGLVRAEKEEKDRQEGKEPKKTIAVKVKAIRKRMRTWIMRKEK